MKILALGALDAARLAARGKGLCWSRGQGRTCPFRRRLGRSGAWPLRRPRAKHPGRPQGCQRRACTGGVASRAGLHQGSPRPSALRAGRTDRARRARAGLAHRDARSSRSRSSFFRITGRPATTSWDSSACPLAGGHRTGALTFIFIFIFICGQRALQGKLRWDCCVGLGTCNSPAASIPLSGRGFRAAQPSLSTRAHRPKGLPRPPRGG